jgi:hypothetical protein
MAGQNGSYSMLGIKNATLEIASLAHLMIKNKQDQRYSDPKACNG